MVPGSIRVPQRSYKRSQGFGALEVLSSVSRVSCAFMEFQGPLGRLILLKHSQNPHNLFEMLLNF